MKKLAYVIEPTFGMDAYAKDFGYDVYTSGKWKWHEVLPDVVFFMGGTDIETRLYNEKPLPQTQRPNLQRDAYEINLYQHLKSIPKIGICRGAQLLCVLNGGSLWQHVNGHEFRGHPIWDVYGKSVISSSVHHQQMILPKEAKLIAWTKNVSNLRAKEGKKEEGPITREPEIAYLPATKDKGEELWVQGHPEFGPNEFTKYFFELVDKLIWKKNDTTFTEMVA